MEVITLFGFCATGGGSNEGAVDWPLVRDARLTALNPSKPPGKDACTRTQPTNGTNAGINADTVGLESTRDSFLDRCSIWTPT
jgi:hypothetical protein